MRKITEAAAGLFARSPAEGAAYQPVDPKRALTVRLQQTRDLDPDPHRMAVNPLLTAFLKGLIPGLDPSTLEFIEDEKRTKQTDKGGVASFHAIAVSGALLANRGIEGLRVVCKWNFGSKRELSIWEQERRGAIEGSLPFEEPFSISFFTQEAWERGVQEARRRPSIANAEAVRRGIVATELADRSSFATVKVHVDATGLGVSTRTYRNRKDPDGVASIEPVVQAVVRKLERAVNNNTYLPRLEKARRVWDAYATNERQKGLNPGNA